MLRVFPRMEFLYSLLVIRYTCGCIGWQCGVKPAVKVMVTDMIIMHVQLLCSLFLCMAALWLTSPHLDESYICLQ